MDQLVLRDRDTSDPANGTLDERLYALQDANWNVTALLNASGNALERYLCEPYGKITITDGSFKCDASSFDNPYAFTGRRFDSESGLYCYRNRYYHFQVGQFVCRDSMGYADGSAGLYQYTLSSPIAHVDSNGQQATSPNISVLLFAPAIKIVNAYVNPCVDAYFGVKFILPPQAQGKDGYIVQEIRNSENVFDCDGNRLNLNFTPVFYEAFFLFGINLRSKTSDPDDHFILRGDLRGTRGTVRTKGIAKGVANMLHLPPDFIPGSVPEARTLPATRAKPYGFDTAPGTRHDWTITWDCCCPDNCVTMNTVPPWAINVTVGPNASGACPQQIPNYFEVD